jgi:hypothetical protein
VSLFPFVSFDRVTLAQANARLEEWGHRMGPLQRGGADTAGGDAFALCAEGRPVAVVTHSYLIAGVVGGGLWHLTRENTVELSRLCACRPHLCRVALRLWRELVFPTLGRPYAISYQDRDLHTGATYRFDGWERHAVVLHSGRDTRTGRRGRDKYVWVWPRGSLQRGA